ncbi:MAG: hypothetical protein V1842_00030 [Candidatus Omnitrophota bacterium]
MVKINLMPSELGPIEKSLPMGLIVKAKKILILSNILVLVTGLSLRALTFYKKRGLSTITDQYQQAKVFNNKINSLKKQQDELNAELNFLESNLKEDILWSKELAQLRSIVPQEVWLRRLAFEKKGKKDAEASKLTFRGGTISQGRLSSMEILGRFLSQLQEDKVLALNFNNPNLKDSHAEKYRSIEITAFSIEMPLK